MAAVDRFVAHMSVLSAEAFHFLLKTGCSFEHQILVTLRPQFIAMQQGAGDTTARGFHHVLLDRLGREWRKLAMPVDNLVGFKRGIHGDPSDGSKTSVMQRRSNVCDAHHRAVRTHVTRVRNESTKSDNVRRD